MFLTRGVQKTYEPSIAFCGDWQVKTRDGSDSFVKVHPRNLTKNNRHDGVIQDVKLKQIKMNNKNEETSISLWLV